MADQSWLLAWAGLSKGDYKETFVFRRGDSLPIVHTTETVLQHYTTIIIDHHQWPIIHIWYDIRLMNKVIHIWFCSSIWYCVRPIVNTLRWWINIIMVIQYFLMIIMMVMVMVIMLRHPLNAGSTLGWGPPMRELTAQPPAGTSSWWCCDNVSYFSDYLGDEDAEASNKPCFAPLVFDQLDKTQFFPFEISW